MKTVPSYFNSKTKEVYRVGSLITFNAPEDQPAGIVGNHDALRITKIEKYEKRAGYYAFHFVCLDCNDENTWAATRLAIDTISRLLTELETKRVIKDIGVE